MDKNTAQFFGDAKRIQLSPLEKSEVWHMLSLAASSKKISLHSIEKANAFTYIASHMHRHPISSTKKSLSVHWFAIHKLLASMLVAVVLISIGGASVTYASDGAMPEDLLYPIKLNVTEPMVDIVLQFHPERRAQWSQTRLNRRLEEAEHLSSSDNLTTDRRERLEEHIAQRIATVERHLENVSEEMKLEIQERITAAMQKHQEFLERVESGAVHPDEIHLLKEHMRTVQKNMRPDGGRLSPPPVLQQLRSDDINPTKRIDNLSEGKRLPPPPPPFRDMKKEEKAVEVQFFEDRHSPRLPQLLPDSAVR